MPIHDFKNNATPQQSIVLPTVKELLDSSHVNYKDLLLPLELPMAQVNTELMSETLSRGFMPLDEAILNYFADIRVPGPDFHRFMRVKMAGGDRSVQIWMDDLKNGRAALPVAAIERPSDSHNPEKYSPPIIPMRIRYLNSERSEAAKVFRPAPFNVEYTMLIWTEHKSDFEYIRPQIANRFNSSMAEFRMSDGHIQGNVQLKYGGTTDATDKEVGENDVSYRRWEISFTAEAWLPLPEIHGHTVLGQPKAITEETSGETFVRAHISN